MSLAGRVVNVLTQDDNAEFELVIHQDVAIGLDRRITYETQDGVVRMLTIRPRGPWNVEPGAINFVSNVPTPGQRFIRFEKDGQTGTFRIPDGEWPPPGEPIGLTVPPAHPERRATWQPQPPRTAESLRALEWRILTGLVAIDPQEDL